MSASPGLPPECPEGRPPFPPVELPTTIYRQLKRRPPSNLDLRTHAERGVQPLADPWKRCGLSVYLTLGDAEHNCELFPSFGRLIGAAIISPAHGLLGETPAAERPSHATWWPNSGIDRAALFTIEKEVEL